MAGSGLICRIEVHRDRLVETLKAQNKMRYSRTRDFKNEDEELQYRCETQADEMSAILACIRLVLEPQ